MRRSKKEASVSKPRARNSGLRIMSMAATRANRVQSCCSGLGGSAEGGDSVWRLRVMAQKTIANNMSNGAVDCMIPGEFVLPDLFSVRKWARFNGWVVFFGMSRAFPHRDFFVFMIDQV